MRSLAKLRRPWPEAGIFLPSARRRLQDQLCRFPEPKSFRHFAQSSQAFHLQHWLQLQREHLNEGSLPKKERRLAAAQEALQRIRKGQEEVFLPPEDLLHILKDSVLCPAFSLELLQLLQKHVFCEGFDSVRRQFFQNQVLHLYSELALSVRESYQILTQTSEVLEEPQLMESLFMFEAVLNQTHPGQDASNEHTPEDGEPKEESQEHAAFGDRQGVLVDFLVDAAQAQQLSASGRHEVFYFHRISAEEPEEKQDGPAPRGRASGRGWMLGVAEVVKAPPRSEVFLLSARLYPLGQDEVHAFDKGARFQVVPISDILPIVLHREVEAIWAVCRQDESVSRFVDDLIFGSAACIQAMATVVEVDDAELNQQQLAAVARASSAKLTLVQGPPGTGKSEVAAAIVQQWVKDDTESVLVATSTHAAKDVLAERLRRRQIRPSTRARNQRPQEAKDSQVFVETVYMSSARTDRTVQKVLLDESSQITTAAALVALTHGCEKLVLIGDPQQLGPVSSFGPVSSTSSFAAFAEERRSFFEVLADRFQLQPHRLQVQHRMDSRLCEYPSHRFYGGQLETAASVEVGGVAERMFPPGLTFKAGTPGHPVVFVDTSEIQTCREKLVPFFGSLSLHNRMEAQIVAELLHGFKEAAVDPSGMCVLTAYKAQDSLLAEAIHGSSSTERVKMRKGRTTMIREQGVDPLSKEPHPRIYTVDGFQGNESDYVFYSAVRSGSTATGFVGNPQRLCVLLTRARRGLIIVGSRETLQHTEEWQQWLQSAEKQEFVVDDELVARLQRREVAQRGPL